MGILDIKNGAWHINYSLHLCFVFQFTEKLELLSLAALELSSDRGMANIGTAPREPFQDRVSISRPLIVSKVSGTVAWGKPNILSHEYGGLDQENSGQCISLNCRSKRHNKW